jgi:hypothetical protein
MSKQRTKSPKKTSSSPRPQSESIVASLPKSADQEIKDIKDQIRVTLWKTIRAIVTAALTFLVYFVIALCEYMFYEAMFFFLSSDIDNYAIIKSLAEDTQILLAAITLAGGIAHAITATIAQIASEVKGTVHKLKAEPDL